MKPPRTRTLELVRTRVRGVVDGWTTWRRRRLAARLLEVEVAPRFGLRALEPLREHFGRRVFAAARPGGGVIVKLYSRGVTAGAPRGVRMHALLAAAGVPLPAIVGAGFDAPLQRRFGHGYVVMERIGAAPLARDAEAGRAIFAWLGRLARVGAPAAAFAENAVLTLAKAERSIATARARLLRAGVPVDAASFDCVARRIRAGLAALDGEGIAPCAVYADCKAENFVRPAGGDPVVVDLDGLGFGHPLVSLAKGLLHFPFGDAAERIGAVAAREVMRDRRLDPLIDAYFAAAPDGRRAFEAHRDALLLWSYLRLVGFAALRAMEPLPGESPPCDALRREARERWARLVEAASE